MLIDIATRVHNHNWKVDPIFRSMLDTDFYKLLMAQLIWSKHKDVQARFTLINRTKSVRIADEIDMSELIEQLEHARSVKLTRSESSWLRGNTFYGKRQIFQPEFIDWLENFKLPEYDIAKQDGQYYLDFDGPWLETTFWEIPALSIINELRSRAVLKHHSKFEIDVIYARAKAKLWDKAERLKKLYAMGYEFKVSDFGTRRRHSFLWQRWAVQAMSAALGSNFIGTSNTLLAMENNMEAIGTNAHELPMVYAALSNGDYELAKAPYRVLHDWAALYDGNLKVILSDAFGSEEFFSHSDEVNRWLATWKGIRPDSMDYRQAVPMILDFWDWYGANPKEKLVILSDGMDIDNIEDSVRRFSKQTNISIGWGTNLTNDFKGCMPDNSESLKAISLVCKVAEANGRPAVKLSDNPTKATGEKPEVERYKKVFNYNVTKSKEVTV